MAYSSRYAAEMRLAEMPVLNIRKLTASLSCVVPDVNLTVRVLALRRQGMCSQVEVVECCHYCQGYIAMPLCSLMTCYPPSKVVVGVASSLDGGVSRCNLRQRLWLATHLRMYWGYQHMPLLPEALDHTASRSEQAQGLKREASAGVRTGTVSIDTAKAGWLYESFLLLPTVTTVAICSAVKPGSQVQFLRQIVRADTRHIERCTQGPLKAQRRGRGGTASSISSRRATDSILTAACHAPD